MKIGTFLSEVNQEDGESMILEEEEKQMGWGRIGGTDVPVLRGSGTVPHSMGTGGPSSGAGAIALESPLWDGHHVVGTRIPT